MKLLSLDLSSKTGWAVFEKGQLLHYGLITSKIPDYKASIYTYKDFPETYPQNLINVSKSLAEACLEVYRKYGCTHVVVEHTEKHKQRVSQKFLEFLHYAVFDAFEGIPVRFLLVADWRKHVGCRLANYPEFKEWNKVVAKAKKKAKPNAGGAKVAKIKGKVVSKIDLKKLSIHIANEHFNLEIKNDNVADAINIGRTAVELGLFKA